jgi:hypothetical protein
MWQAIAAAHVKWLTRAARKVAVKGRNTGSAHARLSCRAGCLLYEMVYATMWRVQSCPDASMFRAVVIVFLAFALSACDAVATLKDGLQQSQAVEGDLEQSTGVKPRVGFNWRNGRLTSVTVLFPKLYETKPLGDLAGLVRAAVTKEFKQTPDAIVLSFALDKGPSV